MNIIAIKVASISNKHMHKVGSSRKRGRQKGDLCREWWPTGASRWQTVPSVPSYYMIITDTQARRHAGT